MKKTIALGLGIISLLLVTQPVLAAKKPVVGVAEFTNSTRAHWWSTGVGWDLAGMVSNELASIGSFRVVERSKLEPVLREQDLAASGRVTKGTGAKIGKLTGAQYLVLGTVSAYEEGGSKGGGFSFQGISIGGKKGKAYIAIDLRVVDTTTGELAFVRTVEARTNKSRFSLGLFKDGFGGHLKNEKKTPAGKAIRAVLVEIVDYLDCVMVVKDSCIDEFNAKERKRRKSLKGGISLD